MIPKILVEKGKAFEKGVAALVASMGFGISRRNPGSGNGQIKGDIAWTIPKVAELKNQPSKFGQNSFLLSWIQQAEAQALGGVPWVLILRDPRAPESRVQGFAVLDLTEYLNLEMVAKEPKSKQPDRDLKFKLERLKRLANEGMKLAEEREAKWKFNDLKHACGDVIKQLDY